MKKVVLFMVMLIATSKLFAQEEKKGITQSGIKKIEMKTSKRVGGYPPHGYPCLGCVPCPGNPKEFCSDGKSPAKSFEIHPNVLELGYIVSGEKLVPLEIFLEQNSNNIKLRNTGIEIGNDIQENSQHYPCGCGSNVYGKDKAACARICKFLETCTTWGK